jgi:hypothetical protein
MQVQYRRADGSFVALINGLPYHIAPGDPLFAAAQAAGGKAPFEPQPPAPTDEQKRARMKMTFAQLLIGLVAENWITEAEGEAWLAGTLPAAVSALIATLPAGQRFPAKARASRPSVVLRTDPLVTALAAAQNKTPENLDTFFTTYAEA